MCVCVCVSAREHVCGGTARPIFRNFLRGTSVAVARSSSSGIAIRYVLPVLSMTSRLAVAGSTTMRCDTGAESDVYE